MPKMTHWNSPTPIDVSPDKQAVYAAQGWVVAGRAPAPALTAMTTAAAAEPSEAPKPAPAKKAAKKPAKRAAKKS